METYQVREVLDSFEAGISHLGPAEVQLHEAGDFFQWRNSRIGHIRALEAEVCFAPGNVGGNGTDLYAGLRKFGDGLAFRRSRLKILWQVRTRQGWSLASHRGFRSRNGFFTTGSFRPNRSLVYPVADQIRLRFG